jgi:hypothetical protein
VIVSKALVTALDGTLLRSTRRSIVARGEGGFGGARPLDVEHTTRSPV